MAKGSVYGEIGDCKPPRLTGEDHPNYKGGRRVRAGYVLVLLPDDDPRKTKHKRYIQEHRLVMERHIGRRLDRKEVVHHINGNRQDNRIENLELLPSHRHHLERHGLDPTKMPYGAENPLIPCACGCGTMIQKWGAQRRAKRYAMWHHLKENNARAAESARRRANTP